MTGKETGGMARESSLRDYRSDRPLIVCQPVNGRLPRFGSENHASYSVTRYPKSQRLERGRDERLDNRISFSRFACLCSSMMLIAVAFDAFWGLDLDCGSTQYIGTSWKDMINVGHCPPSLIVVYHQYLSSGRSNNNHWWWWVAINQYQSIHFLKGNSHQPINNVWVPI